MKKSIACTGLLITIALFFTTCRKIDWEHVIHGPGKRDCNLVAYSINTPNIPQPFLFNKKYNASGDLAEIEARFANLQLSPRYHLRVAYDNQKVYLIKMDSPYDTSMTLLFNEQGRVERAIGDETLFSYRFHYRQNRLYSIDWEYYAPLVLHDTCTYDAKGNILSICHRGGTADNSVKNGYFYQYDYTKKAKYQFYMDEKRYVHNGFTLLQYLDLFPELTPVNLRIHSRMGEETGYAESDLTLANHRIDANGKLLGYDLILYFDGQPHKGPDVSLNWDCNHRQ